MVPVDLSYVAVPPSWKKLSKFSLVTTALCRLFSSTERTDPSEVARLFLTLGVSEESVVSSDAASVVVSTVASVTSFTLATA